MANTKKAAKGFSGLRIFTVTQNNAEGYEVGQKITISGAQTFVRNPQTTDWQINADDGIYDSGSDWNGENFTLTLAELPLEHKKYFEGGTYDEATKTYHYRSTDQAPELALAFRVLQSDGSWLMVKFFSCKCRSVKIDHQTKGQSGEIASVTIEGLIMNRIYDSKVKEEKEATTEGDLTWLDTIESLPIEN